MNQELVLKLQAHADGELSPAETREITALLESNREARALHDQLGQMSACIRDNEPALRLPESREFFWNKIEREIKRLEAEPARPAAPWWLAGIRRHIAAFSGVGVATLLLLVGAFQLHWVSPDMLEEIDNPMDDNSISFRSESQKMTVVWISDAIEMPDDDNPDSDDEAF